VATARLEADMARMGRLVSSGFTRGMWHHTDEEPTDQTAGLSTDARKDRG
jgi:hypothetical protein